MPQAARHEGRPAVAANPWNIPEAATPTTFSIRRPHVSCHSATEYGVLIVGLNVDEGVCPGPEAHRAGHPHLPTDRPTGLLTLTFAWGQVWAADKC